MLRNEDKDGNGHALENHFQSGNGATGTSGDGLGAMVSNRDEFGNNRRRGGKKSGPSGTTNFTGRGLTARVKTARGRKSSSTRWLDRQLNDPYVAEAQKRGLRSRAAFKLMEMDDKLALLKSGMRVVDLGAAPGGWSMVAVDRVRAGSPGGGRVVGIDLLEMEPIAGAMILRGDFLAEDAPERIAESLDGPAHMVMSDMAAFATGHKATDHLRVVGLCEAALAFAEEILAPGGVFVAKVLKGGTEKQLLQRMKRNFREVRHAKPPSSRPDSAEEYVVARDFRGPGED